MFMDWSMSQLHQPSPKAVVAGRRTKQDSGKDGSHLVMELIMGKLLRISPQVEKWGHIGGRTAGGNVLSCLLAQT